MHMYDVYDVIASLSSSLFPFFSLLFNNTFTNYYAFKSSCIIRQVNFSLFVPCMKTFEKVSIKKSDIKYK